jgi:hypothetical protein
MLSLALCASALLLGSLPALANTDDEFDPGSYRIQLDPLFYSRSPAAGNCLIQGNNGSGGPVRYFWGPTAPNRNTSQPSMAACGFPSFDQFLDNGQGVFILKRAGFGGLAGENGYVLVNKRSGQCLQYDRNTGRVAFSSKDCDPETVTNPAAIWWIKGSGRHGFSPIKPFLDMKRCLIFGNNGYDEAPTTHRRWGESASDLTWCGLGSETWLENTGQGLFLLMKVAD